jgi:transposase
VRARSNRDNRSNNPLSATLLPDLNPIEKLFSKFKAMLRKAARRTRQTLWDEIGRIIDTFSPVECQNYFNAAGYVCN